MKLSIIFPESSSVVLCDAMSLLFEINRVQRYELPCIEKDLKFNQ